MNENKVKVFFGLGGNFISAVPDTNYSAQGMANCDLTVHVSTKLNRSHLVTGKEALILPCLGRSEKDYQKSGETNSERRKFYGSRFFYQRNIRTMF